jgi:hypothetical protein
MHHKISVPTRQDIELYKTLKFISNRKKGTGSYRSSDLQNSNRRNTATAEVWPNRGKTSVM